MHERYVELVRSLNEKNLLLSEKIRRGKYLKGRMDQMKSCKNLEQYEAYLERLRSYKPVFLALLEDITELERQIDQTPRTKIC
ncbi:MAG: hypothetical protein WC525_07530 [Candidatus Thermoplasmatota archaeon]